MRFRPLTLLIMLTVGLVLLECGLYMLPGSLELPGGMLTWVLLVAAFHYIIPIAFIMTLVAILILSNPARPT